MNARRLFEWYPIQRLDRVQPVDEPPRGMGPSTTLVLRRQQWEATVRRQIGVDELTRLPIWSTPEQVDLSPVEAELRGAHEDGCLFKLWTSESEGEALERLRHEINAAAEVRAARTKEWLPRGR